MTKYETNELKKAIKFFMEDDGWEKGMEILRKLTVINIKKRNIEILKGKGIVK